MSAQSGPRCKYCGQPDNGSAATIVCEACNKEYRSQAITRVKDLSTEIAKIINDFDLTVEDVRLDK